MRTTVLAALVAVAVATPAGALGSKAACLQVTDETGDAHLGSPNVPTSPVNFESLDVVSADIATGAKNIVVAIRVKTLAAKPETTGGSTYNFYWSSGGSPRGVSYRTWLDGPPDATYMPDGATTSAVAISAYADPGTNTLYFTVPRKLDPALKKKGTKLSGFTVQTFFAVNRKGGITTSSADRAESARTYVDGAPTCLKGV